MNETASACPARYEYAGLFQSSETWIHPTRVIDTHEIVLVTTGTVRLFEEDARWALHAGELIVLRPGRKHGGFQESHGETGFYWIHFGLDGPDTLPAAPLKTEDSARMGTLCRQLLHVANAPGYPAYAAQSAFALLYCELMREAEGQKSASRAADEAAEWIRINSARRLTAADAAAHAGYHPDYLSALFKAAYSLTLKQYIARERMKLIHSQLLTTADSLRTIARRLDFDGEEQLIHYFRYHEGLSPTQYRNLYDHTHLNKA